ncbi:MAG: RDD family protein [Caulobacteraceae bacterium]|nr:RDD family protein [Caulobacter sp.]
MTAVAPSAEPGLLRRFVTPEGVDLRLVLGSAGQRLAAFLLDALILLATVFAFSLACLFAGVAIRQASLFVIWTLGFFALRNGYFLYWELRPRAATPGKRAMGLRVASRDGGRLRADAVFARNAMREVELFLPLTFLGMSFAQGAWLVGLAGIGWSAGLLLLPLFNRDRLRAGDLIAGTWVVRQPRRGLLRDMAETGEALAERFRFTSAQLDAYGEMELHVLEEVVRQRQPAMVKDVAARIRRKIGWAPAEGERDLDFLDAFYAAQRRTLERGLLFGARRKDKHDRR